MLNHQPELKLLIILIGFLPIDARAQQMLTLDSCINMAEQNYPMIQKMNLIATSGEYTVENVGKGKLPRLVIAGQASYQSDVTSLPGGMGPQISKDQYKLYGEINQPLTDWSAINRRQRIAEIGGDIERQDLSIQLYQVKERVSQLYFSILLLNRQLLQTGLTLDQLKGGLYILDQGVKNGIVLKSEADLLRAEMLALEQKEIEIRSSIDGFLLMLGRFINQEIASPAHLKDPEIDHVSTEIARPELDLFSAQLRANKLQGELISADNIPKLSLFLQSGIGRPALNFLSNDLEFYYIGGLRLSWNLASLYTSGNQKEVVLINEQMIESRRETFLFNTRMTLDKQSTAIEQAESLLEKDEAIIQLRENIRETARQQLENGVITATEYKDAVIQESKARYNLEVHKIELLQAKKEYQLTTGNFN